MNDFEKAAKRLEDAQDAYRTKPTAAARKKVRAASDALVAIRQTDREHRTRSAGNGAPLVEPVRAGTRVNEEE